MRSGMLQNSSSSCLLRLIKQHRGLTIPCPAFPMERCPLLNTICQNYCLLKGMLALQGSPRSMHEECLQRSTEVLTLPCPPASCPICQESTSCNLPTP